MSPSWVGVRASARGFVQQSPVSLPINGEPATVGNGSTIGLACQSPEQVDAWHAAGVAHGGTTCEDPPGLRELAVGSLYLAYLRDPDGNKLCGLYRVPKG